MVQIRCHKAAGTKIYKCLVGQSPGYIKSYDRDEGSLSDKNLIASLLKVVETKPPKKKERKIFMIIISITLPTKIKNLVNKCTTVTKIMFSSR